VCFGKFSVIMGQSIKRFRLSVSSERMLEISTSDFNGVSSFRVRFLKP
jgi:hypothetical protein